MDSQTSTWEETLSQATARGSNIVHGVILAAITSSGKQLYSKAAGYNGLSPTAPPVTKDNTYWIASCTKLLTSIAALQCVERGLVDLDEPVEKWLPEFINKPIISLKDNQLVETQPKTKVTLRHLLTNTSGMEYDQLSPTLQAWRAQNPHTLTRNVTKLFNTPLGFEPGCGWAYGTGIAWAGVLVERLNNNITLGDYYQAHIFALLGDSQGKSTTFSLNSPSARQSKISERLLTNVHRQDDGSLTEQFYRSSTDEMLENSGGGGLYSSADDYMLILQDIIAPEPKLLKKQNVEEWMFRGHITNETALEQLRLAQATLIPEVGGARANHALGGLFCEDDGGLLPKGTLVWAGLPNLKWFANREKGVAAFFATQVTPHGDKLAQDLAMEYIKEILRIHKESS